MSVIAYCVENGPPIGYNDKLEMEYINANRKLYILINVILVCIILSGCGSPAVVVNSIDTVTDATLDSVTIPYAIEYPGTLCEMCDSAEIDYSNTSKGYITVYVFDGVTDKIKVQIEGPEDKYTYNIESGEVAAFPLTNGDGQYTASVYENLEGTKYVQILSVSFDVVLENEFYPFLYPNQFVNYAIAPNTVATAKNIADSANGTLDMIDKVYLFVSRSISYDYDLAASVKSGYIPVVDKVLSTRTGICFDYAALMASMLRCSGIPCKMVFGYADDAYHAWISVYSDEEGWLEGIVQFDGKSWKRIDPTMASQIEGGQKITYTDKLCY